MLLYRYADVFFCGCTPELLVRKRGNEVESMCLAGTCPAGATEEERARLADELMADAKNRAEHDHVVRFIREVFNRTCYDVDVPAQPGILPLTHVQHLCTPARARMLEGGRPGNDEGRSASHARRGGHAGGRGADADQEHRSVQPRVLRGRCGYVDGAGNGEFSVALRTGVFDGEVGWVYAGCGIVEGSVADDEYDEIGMKLKTVLSAFDGGEVPSACQPTERVDAAASRSTRSVAADEDSRTKVSPAGTSCEARHAPAIDPSLALRKPSLTLRTTGDIRVMGVRDEADPTASALFLGAFFDELERWGVHDVVVSPGSRSTPLAMTAYELSRRFPDRLRLFVDVDERGAAFFALGLAKASGQPAAVICTSGTAVANYYPAVLEPSRHACRSSC